MGRETRHIKIEMIDNGSANIMSGIAFGQGEIFEHMKADTPFDICYTIEEMTFNGKAPHFANKKSIMQLSIKDIVTDTKERQKA